MIRFEFLLIRCNMAPAGFFGTLDTRRDVGMKHSPWLYALDYVLETSVCLERK